MRILLVSLLLSCGTPEAPEPPKRTITYQKLSAPTYRFSLKDLMYSRDAQGVVTSASGMISMTLDGPVPGTLYVIGTTVCPAGLVATEEYFKRGGYPFFQVAEPPSVDRLNLVGTRLPCDRCLVMGNCAPLDSPVDLQVCAYQLLAVSLQ